MGTWFTTPVYPDRYINHRSDKHSCSWTETANLLWIWSPHNEIALQIARQAKVPGSDEQFAVVFAAMGITKEEENQFMAEFERTGALEHAVVF